MIRNFFRHLLESIKSLKRNGWMTVASVSAVTISLSLVGIFLLLIFNATKLAEDISKNVNVSVFIDIGTEQAEVDTLKTDLAQIKNIEPDSIEFSSRDNELKKITDAMGDSWKLFEGDSNPLYDVYIVSATDPEYTKQVAEDASKLPNVFKADYGGDSSDKIFKIASAVKTWGLGAAIVLIFVAMFLISNTIRITIMSRQREIQIMRLVGAKNGFIRWPFFLEGAWIGLIGAIVPILLLTFGYRQAFVMFNRYLLQSNFTLIRPENLLIYVNPFIAITGTLIGAFGAIISMRRFLKI